MTATSSTARNAGSPCSSKYSPIGPISPSRSESTSTYPRPVCSAARHASVDFPAPMNPTSATCLSVIAMPRCQRR